jgi:hypothetical protein
LPHSNFHPELEITNDGAVIRLAGPIEAEEDDDKLAGISISAVVTQAPVGRADPPGVQQGANGAGLVQLPQSALRLADDWECTAQAQGGAFREDWAFATAEMIETVEDGAVEKYTWSQWVWLRHP